MFLWWVFLALLHSAIVFGLPVFFLRHDVLWGSGRTGDYLAAGNMVYTYTVVTVCLKVDIKYIYLFIIFLLFYIYFIIQ